MKRLFAILTASVLVLAAWGCQKEAAAGATMEVNTEHAWRAEEITLPDGWMPEKLYTAGSDVVMRVYDRDYVHQSGAVWRAETGEAVLLGGNGVPVGAAQTEDGLTVFWEKYETDETGAATELCHTLVTYDEALRPVQTEDRTDAYGEPSQISAWYADAAGNQVISAGGDLYYYTADCTEIGTFSGKLTGITDIFAGGDGTLYGVSSSGMPTLGRLDTADMSITAYRPEGAPAQMWGFFPAQGDGLYVTDTATGLYALQGGSAELRIDWKNSDVDGLDSDNMAVLPDGSFLMIEVQPYVQGENSNRRILLHLEERSEAELAAMKRITLAMLQQDNELLELVRRFNRCSDDCRIVVRDFETEANGAEQDYSRTRQALFDELTRGNVPDILCLTGFDYLALSEKGMLRDWYPYMEADASFRRSDYLMNLYDALALQGRHERFAYTMRVTTLACDDVACGDGPVTVQELLDAARHMPPGMTLSGSSTPEQLLPWLIRYEDYVDFSQGTCSFDSEAFVSLLELAAMQPQQPPVPDMQAYSDGRALLLPTDLSIMGLMDLHSCYFPDGRFSLPGTPCSGTGNGGTFRVGTTLAMSAQSAYPEEVWAFFRFCLEEENQRMVSGIPVALDVLGDCMDLYTADGTYGWTDSDGQHTLAPATPEMTARLMDYYKGICSVDMDWCWPITDIVSEEAQVYFAGDRTAQETAAAIQSRVSLYLAEQQ